MKKNELKSLDNDIRATAGNKIYAMLLQPGSRQMPHFVKVWIETG